MTGRYQYELIRSDGTKKRIRADAYRLEGNFFEFVDFDEGGSEVVKRTINTSLVLEIHQVADALIPGSGE